MSNPLQIVLLRVPKHNCPLFKQFQFQVTAAPIYLFIFPLQKFLLKLLFSSMREVHSLGQHTAPDHDSRSTVLYSWEEVLMFACSALFFYTHFCAILPRTCPILSTKQAYVLWKKCNTLQM